MPCILSGVSLRLLHQKIGRIQHAAGQHHILGIEQIDHIGNANAQVLSGIVKDLAHQKIATVGHLGGIDQQFLQKQDIIVHKRLIRAL